VGKQVTATYHVSKEDFWDKDALLQTLAVDTVDVLRAGFADPRIRRVNVVYLVAMTDEFGNEDVERGVEIDWTRKL